jgi:3-oxoacyl-[acyl-carrier protein] reductase
MTVRDKVVLVVGGSHSIGRAIATEFAAQGARTVVCSRPKASPPDFSDLAQRGLAVRWEPGDMTDPASMQAVVKRVVADLGSVDVLVVSGAPAGAKADLFADMPTAQYRQTFDTQFVAKLNCLHAVVGPMKARNYGKVIFVTSDAGRTPTPGESMVGAAAAALMFFTRAVGRELARDGIRVNCIGTTLTKNTAVHERSQAHGENHVLSKAFASIEARSPFGMNVPEDIAKLAVFLGSSDSDQISGAIVSVNGGLSFP